MYIAVSSGDLFGCWVGIIGPKQEASNNMTTLKNRLLGAAVGVAVALGAQAALAEMAIKFSLDWKYEGPAAPYLLAKKNGAKRTVVITNDPDYLPILDSI